MPGNTPQVAARQTKTCSALAQEALTAARQACGAATTDSLCFGYDTVKAAFTGSADATFKSQGDQVGLSTVSSVTTSAANLDAGNWGVAVLNIQADLPTSGKGLTGVLFGDATLTSNADPGRADALTLPVKAAGGDVLLRGGAGPNFPSALKLPAGQSAVVDGRNKAGDWLRVRIGMAVGWGHAAQLKVDGDSKTLTVLDDQDTHAEALYKAPMQTFVLSTGSSAACPGEAPSGLLLQLSGDQTAHILVNGADLTLSSATLFLRATPKDRLDVAAITGTATVTAMGGSATINASEWVRLRLGGKDGLSVASGPNVKTKYSFAVVDGAPVALLPGGVPCTVGLPTANARATVRVGPGEERGSLFFMRPDISYTAIGWANDSKSAPWWKIGTPENKQAWVEQAVVHSIGTCAQVEKADIPPVIVAAPPLPTPGGETGTGGTTADNTGGQGFAPTVPTFWNVDPGLDNLVGTCPNVAPINYCPSLVRLAPQGTGILFKGQELQPYYMYRVRENVYAYSGPAPEALGPGTIKLTLAFSSPTAWKVTRILVLAAAPDCQHVYTFTGTFLR